jgi:hypothetical protein
VNGYLVAIREGEVWKRVLGTIRNDGKPSIWVDRKALPTYEDETVGTLLGHVFTDIKEG